MNSKTYGIVIGAIVVLALVGAIFYFSGNSPSGQKNSSSENYTPALSPAQKSLNQNQTEAPVSNSKPAVNSQPQIKEIVFTDSGFSPSNITIKSGTTVVFKNNSSRSFRPASDPHPIHNGYPTTGGCVNSTFDACQNIFPGGSWSFKFDVTGSWGYHDHLNPSFKGTIVVE